MAEPALNSFGGPHNLELLGCFDALLVQVIAFKHLLVHLLDVVRWVGQVGLGRLRENLLARREEERLVL